MKNLADKPAFPRTPCYVEDPEHATCADFGEYGMTYRQWLVGKIMAGFAAVGAKPDDAARHAVSWADALIAALEAPPSKAEMTHQQILEREG